MWNIINLNFGWVQHDDWCIYSSIINIIKCIDDTNLVGLNLAHPHNAPSHDEYTAHKPIQLSSSSLPATDSLHLPLPALHLLGQQVWHLRRGPLIRPPLKGAPQKNLPSVGAPDLEVDDPSGDLPEPRSLAERRQTSVFDSLSTCITVFRCGGISSFQAAGGGGIYRRVAFIGGRRLFIQYVA